MKRTIFSKLIIGHLFIIFFLSFLILTFSFRMVRTFHIESLKNDLEKLAQLMEKQVFPFIEKDDVEKLDAQIKETAKALHVRITVIGIDGKVLADSEQDPHSMENHRNRIEIIRALGEGYGSSIRYSTTVGEDMLYVAIPIKSKDEIKGILRVSLFLKDIRYFLGQFKKNIIQIVVVIILLSIVASIIFSRTLSRPVRELSLAARKVATGDFDVSVRLSNKDELNELGESFNFMTAKVKALFSEISKQKEELGSVISSIQEGLCVMDKSGKVILSNQSFKKIAGIEKTKDKFYWEVIRKTSFADLIKDVLQDRKNEQLEIELHGRIYICSATFLPLQENITVIFFDMTELRKLEQMKKDFVVNVSHELRTPLTAIKGFVETMEEDIDKKNKQYLDIIKRHTNRLINIVEDLLILSKMEEKEAELEMEEVDLKKLIQNVLKIFDHSLKDKNIILSLSAEGDLPKITMDIFKMEQVFINIIDNAIKYTEKGSIDIMIKKNMRNLIVEISDTGIGISQEDIPRIFERFYVVDKSRSRRLGGTGLGLSIVKHIILLHRGTIH
ncbi:MAG: HAMP domain-containing protein, partial [Candidatus Aureabacteria bacterium]|nr:HAMP domain-containing protein [Candidatus Auribacterota bacterium]